MRCFRNVFISYDYAAEIFLGETILPKLLKKMFCQQAKTLLRARRSPALQIAQRWQRASEPAGAPPRPSQGEGGGRVGAGRRSDRGLRVSVRAGDRLHRLSGDTFALQLDRNARALFLQRQIAAYHVDTSFAMLRRRLHGS